MEEESVMCYICSVKFPTMKDLSQHVNNLTERYYCTDCDGHFSKKHPCPKSKLLCAFCRQSVKRPDIRYHRCFHFYGKSEFKNLKSLGYYHCYVCNRDINTREIIDHNNKCNRESTIIKVWNCRECNLTFKRRQEYKNHCLSYHIRGTTVKEESNCKTYRRPKKCIQKYNCTLCKLEFETSADYRRHRYTVHDMCSQICFVCGKSVVNVTQHMKVHGSNTRVECPRCNKTFSSKRQLYRHRLVHSQEFKHKCSTCGKGFKTPFSLKVHKRSHDAVKPFECVVCLKTFTTKQWRDNHLKTH